MTDAEPDPQLDLLRGEERLETHEILGRPARKGAPDDLSVSDAERLREAIRDGEVDRARALVQVLHDLYAGMLSTYVEWSLAWRAFVTARTAPPVARAVAESAHEAWTTALDEEPSEVARLVDDLLDPTTVDASTVETYRERLESDDPPPRLTRILEGPEAARAELEEALEAGDPPRAERALETWQEAFRERHDLLARLAWTWPAAVTRRLGQTASEAGLRRTFGSCSFHEPMWEVTEALSPAGLAHLLAEHLRAHFSGPGREGEVLIVEEHDRYRLVMDPCGSGGALRRQMAERRLEGSPVEGFDRLPRATEMTWNRSGEVPAYCAHCALNELTSIERLGHPAWVTEFVPDESKACGWTVYKDPDDIPAEYWERLGMKPPG